MKKIVDERADDMELVLDEAEFSQPENNQMIIGISERPKPLQWLFLSFQHVFAMFGATILVPTMTGFPVSVALFASGIGTLIYTFITKRKVPVYLGSSFAYIGAVLIAVEAMGGDISAAQTGLMLIGLIYVIVAILVKFIGKGWIDKLLPPIVIGPMIAVIGLGLAANAVSNAGFVEGGDLRAMAVAVITFFDCCLYFHQSEGFLQDHSFLDCYSLRLCGIYLLWIGRFHSGHGSKMVLPAGIYLAI